MTESSKDVIGRSPTNGLGPGLTQNQDSFYDLVRCRGTSLMSHYRRKGKDVAVFIFCQQQNLYKYVSAIF